MSFECFTMFIGNLVRTVEAKKRPLPMDNFLTPDVRKCETAIYFAIIDESCGHNRVILHNWIVANEFFH